MWALKGNKQMSNTDDISAFPVQGVKFFGNREVPYSESGLTIRDYFAIRIYTSLLSEGKLSHLSTSDGCKHAYTIADMMVQARSKR